MKHRIRKIQQKIKTWGIKHRIFILTVLLSVFVIDYYNLGFLVGFGITGKQVQVNIIEVITAGLLLLTFYEASKSSKESLRQTELTLRPYIRFSWESAFIGEGRRSEGITDTCIVVSNDGNGLMRSVNYKITVDGKSAGVRSHSIIKPGISTNIVYSDEHNGDESLGSRNDESWKDKNNIIITTKKIKISGQYRDVEGGRYTFNFQSDSLEQSWFKEKSRQKLQNRSIS